MYWEEALTYTFIRQIKTFIHSTFISYRYPEQQVSIPMQLMIGQEYYMEALHKAGMGVDHLSVGVTLPSGRNEWPIPKKYIRFRPHKGEKVWF